MQAQSKYANLGSLHSLIPEDVDNLKKALKNNKIMRAVFLAATIFIFFFIARSLHQNNLEENMPVAFFGALALVVLIGILIQFILRQNFERKTADLNQGMKIVIEGPLEKKKAVSNGKTTTYYFVIKGQRFLVKHNLYKQFSEGDNIQVHVTPTAGHVLYIGAPKKN